jgi:DNA/RNA endonuclease YhcR with UshA esterase domain
VTIARAGIAEIGYFSKGVNLTLTDASGSIRLLLWQDLLEEIPVRLDLRPGSQIWVSGEIEEYEGVLEIVPHEPGDVQVLDHGQQPPPEERSVGGITAADEGRLFTVSGSVTRVESRGWTRVWLADGSGEILVYLPERLLPFLPEGLGPGVSLLVTGEVDIYQGTLEIIPLAGADVVRR